MSGRSRARLGRGALALAVAATVVSLLAPAATRAATINVTTTADEFNSNGGACSLREAIWSASNDSIAMAPGCTAGSGADTIPLPDGTYTLTIAGSNENGGASGDLDVTAGAVTISHQGIGAATIDGGGLDRVFDLIGAGVNATISGVTIRGGAATSAGGGIFVQDATLNLSNSTVTDNASGAGFNGGGIQSNGPATLSNVTLSGNRAGVSGGGLSATSPNLVSFADVTVTGNTADSDANGVGDGGGLSGESVALLIGSTIVAGNTDASPAGTVAPDCTGTVGTAGNNLIGNTTGCAFNPIAAAHLADLVNQDPQLGPLADNGGPTFTHAIRATSPALGKGGVSCPATDQRGVPRPSGACDIGAYELVRCKGGIVNRVGTEGPDTLTGTPAADAFLLFGGNDFADGLDGNDWFCAGAGSDRLNGGAGSDYGVGGAGGDRFIGGSGNDRASGRSGRDKLRGGDGRDKLWGGASRDRLRGGAAKDSLRGGSGSDVCNGGGGRRDRGSSCETEKRIP